MFSIAIPHEEPPYHEFVPPESVEGRESNHEAPGLSPPRHPGDWLEWGPLRHQKRTSLISLLCRRSVYEKKSSREKRREEEN